MKSGTLHMIGHAHIDPVWLWRWPEGLHEIHATFRSALDRMKEFEDFYFTAGSAAFYEWIADHDPDMFEEVRERVQEGRWELAGGWWVEPDCNLPCGESFIRQALYGQRFFLQRLGRRATVGFNPDSFGHHAMLPQILTGCGLDRYVFMRPGPHEKGLPASTFWWESQDGSRVLTARIPFEYLTDKDDVEPHVRKCETEIRPPHADVLCFYGVGNHGGGPTRRNLESIRRLQEDPQRATLRFSTLQDYFDTVRTAVVVHDELQRHAPGCYSAHSGIKRWNRQSELALLAAEKLSVAAHLSTGRSYPTDFDRAWKNVLFNQFHDILAGTSLESAYEDARQQHGEVVSIASRGLNHAMQSIAWRIDLPVAEDTRYLVVFNPHGWSGPMPVEMELGTLKGDDWELQDDTGQAVAWQRVQSEATVNNAARIVFIGDLPSVGWKVYRLQRGTPPEQPVEGPFENDVLAASFDERGALASLFDKRLCIELLAGPGAVGVVLDDVSDTWAHGVVRFDRRIGEFQATSVRTIEHGPVRSSVEVRSEWGNSQLTQVFRLYQGSARLEVDVTVDWREQAKALKLRFPALLSSPRATFEIPYGCIERATSGLEESLQSWMDLSGVHRPSGRFCGLSLLNDGKYSADVEGSTMSLTVLRSPIYAHHDPLVPSPGQSYRYIDQGVQHFRYALLPHDGGWEEAGTVRHAACLNQPPLTMLESCHAGPLPLQRSLFEVDASNIVLGALKMAEDGHAYVVRCQEAHRQETTATLRLGDRQWTARFKPSEIKTFLVQGTDVVESDMLESRESAVAMRNGEAFQEVK